MKNRRRNKWCHSVLENVMKETVEWGNLVIMWIEYFHFPTNGTTIRLYRRGRKAPTNVCKYKI